MSDSRASTRGVIPILLVAAFVVILNETTMNVALNRIMDDLGVTERTVQWLTTAFMLTMAVVIPITGWLLERVPTRRVFMLAMSLFSAGTALCLVAPSFEPLLFGRVVQASGTAMMMPLLMTTIMQLVAADHRGQVMGNISMVISVAPALGPTLSGIILQFGSWRLIFGVVLPIALAVLALGARLLVDVGETRRAPLDVWSIPLTVLAFGPLVYGLSLVGAQDVAAWLPATAIGVGVAALTAFVARQIVLQRRGAALLDLRTFNHPAFTLSVGMMSVAMMALFGTIIMLPLLLQRAYGLPPLQVGLMLLPGGIAMGVLSPLVGRVFDKAGPRVLVIPAGLVVLLVLGLFGTMTTSTPWWAIMAGHIAMSVSFAAIFTPLFTLSLGALPSELYSHGSAVLGTVQQVAGAVGTAVFITVFAVREAAAKPTANSAAEAMLAGARWAFLAAAVIWLGVVVASFFLKAPAESSPDGEAALSAVGEDDLREPLPSAGR